MILSSEKYNFVTLESRHLRLADLRYFDENRVVQPRFSAKRLE
jgi:hypothetical protein